MIDLEAAPCMTPFGALSLAAAVCLSLPMASRADDAAMRLDDGYSDAFVHYRPYVVPSKPKPPGSAPAATPAQAPQHAAPASGPRRVDSAWLRENLPLLHDRAFENPTPENLAAEMYAQRVLVDKSQRYAEMRVKVVHDDPLLDENNRIPYASVGAQAVRNANIDGQQQAVRELAAQGGLLIFVDGACRFCAMQMPVASIVRRNYGMEFLVVSLDASAPKSYGGPVQKDNGLFHKLGLRLTPSIVFVPRPRAYASGRDPNTYLVIAQGYYAADELVKQIAYAGHTTQLLSKQTMASLDVWDRGVASAEDLSRLTLDPNDPQQMRQTLQPLLLKQYEGGPR